MAELDANVDANMEADKDDIKAKAKDTINQNRRNLGIGASIGAAAAIFSTGFIVGHKRAESNSLLQRITRQM